MLSPKSIPTVVVPARFLPLGISAPVNRRFDFAGIDRSMNNYERLTLSINAGRAKPVHSRRPTANNGKSGAVPGDERDAAIRGLLTMRSEARRRKAALASELRMAGKSLYDLGGALKHASGNSLGSRVDHILPKLANVPPVCDLGRLKLLLEELKELESQLAQLNRSASEIGID
jgi:hypothetical protein